MVEAKVKVKGDDQTLIRDFLLYEETIYLSHSDPTLSKIVQDTLADFKGIPDDVLLIFKYTW